MKKVLYAKFSKERGIPFQIMTTIAEENGQRVVEKQAMTKEAGTHLERMEKNSKRLAALYHHPALSVCPCRQKDETTVEFPFQKGKSLENLLTEHVEQGDFEKVKEDVRFLWEVLCSSEGLVPFRVTEEFTDLFGTVEFAGERLAAPISNLDMIFANLLVEENGQERHCHLVDYEWVFDFPIPITFIFARSLILHGMLQTLSREQLGELYAIGGVKEEEIPLYYGMEVSFQKYVVGQEELYVLSKLYPKMKRCCFFLDYWKTEHVYYGVTVLGVPRDCPQHPEELHFSLHFQGEVKETVSIPGSERYQELILRPADTECILKLYGVEGTRSGCSTPAQITGNNAQVHYEDIYHFSETPEFRIRNQGYDSITIGYIVYHRDDYLVKEGIDLRLQIARLQKRLNLFLWPYKAVRKAGRMLKNKKDN